MRFSGVDVKLVGRTSLVGGGFSGGCGWRKWRKVVILDSEILTSL